MLIDHNNIIQKTNLRQNLSEVIERVYNGETIFVSDRGTICAKIVPFEGSSVENNRAQKLLNLQKNIQSELLDTEFAATDTTEFIRSERNKITED